MHGRSSLRVAGLAGAAGGVLLILTLLPASALAVNAPVITSANVTTLTIGAPGAFTVTAVGYPTPSINESGALPSGVTFVDNGNGTATLAGLPASGSSSSYPITITASNGTLPNAVQSFTLTVNGAVANGITSAAGTTFTVGVAGFFLVTATGSPTPSISESGALPSGVTFVDNVNGTATLAGTPAAATNGSYPITITASSGTLSTSQSFILTVSPAGAPSITSAAGTTFSVGVASTFTVTTTGSPTATNIYVSSGSLPSGVTFYNYANGTAVLTGTPAAATNGTYPITITASNGTLSTSQSFILTVSQGTSYLLFATQPGGGAAGAVWSQQPVVEVVNSLNQVVTTDNSTVVYLSIATNPAGGTLSCTGGTSEVAVNGYAYFSGCSINIASASYYTLYATSSPSLTAATSSAFYIGGSNHLVVVTQPGGGAVGAVWSVQPVVAVENASNAVVTTDNSTVVYLSIATNPAGGTLSCTGGTSEVAVNGYAYFSGCSINIASASYYTLYATSSPSLTAATSSAFYVTGNRPSLAISASNALGLKPATGYTTATPKATTVGKYVTWKFTGGTALAGQRMNVMVATKVNGVWGSPKYLKSVWADANGVVTFAWHLESAGAINVRVQWPGSATYGVSNSPARGAYWR